MAETKTLDEQYEVLRECVAAYEAVNDAAENIDGGVFLDFGETGLDFEEDEAFDALVAQANAVIEAREGLDPGGSAEDEAALTSQAVSGFLEELSSISVRLGSAANAAQEAKGIVDGAIRRIGEALG